MNNDLKRKLLIILIGPLTYIILTKLFPPSEFDDSETTNPENDAEKMRGGDLPKGAPGFLAKVVKSSSRAVHKYWHVIVSTALVVVVFEKDQFKKEIKKLLETIHHRNLNTTSLSEEEMNVVKYVDDLNLHGKSAIMQRKIIADNEMAVSDQYKLFKLKLWGIWKKKHEILKNNPKLRFLFIILIIMFYLHFWTGYGLFFAIIRELLRAGKISDTHFEELKDEFNSTFSDPEIESMIQTPEDSEEYLIKISNLLEHVRKIRARSD
jgi:hypothetical protein